MLLTVGDGSSECLHRHISPKPSTVDEWMGVYDLASMWSFDSVRPLQKNSKPSSHPVLPPTPSHLKVRDEASTVLQGLVRPKGGLECIQLGVRYNVGPWIKRGIYLLLKQQDPLALKEMKAGGLTMEAICSIYASRDGALVKVDVPVPEPVVPKKPNDDTWGHTFGRLVSPEPTPPVIHLTRQESGLKQNAEEIFLAEFGAYGGLGKDSLDVDFLFRLGKKRKAKKRALTAEHVWEAAGWGAVAMDQ